MHGTKEARKICVVEVSNFEYSHYSEELMHLLSVNLNLIRRFTKRQVPQGGCMGVWLSLRILDSCYVSVLKYSNPPEVSDPSSS